jgi:hypothetical protein
MTKVQSKPKAKLLGADGNVFNLLGICKRALRTQEGGIEKAQELQSKVTSSGSYHEALAIMMEYCDVC